jgi:predicted AAA+ superfamily ATPase
MAHQLVEEVVREYLIFRGFAGSLKSFDSDVKNDKLRNFRSDKILEGIILAIHESDLQSLREIWGNLQSNLFNKLEYTYNEGEILY